MLEYAHLLHQVVRVATCNVVALDGANGDAGSGRALVVALRQLPQLCERLFEVAGTVDAVRSRVKVCTALATLSSLD